MKDATPGLNLMLKQLRLGSMRDQHQSLADRASQER